MCSSDLGIPIVGYTPQTVKFDGSQSAPGDWTISWGDGSADVTGSGVPPSSLLHTYATAGLYTATLTIVAADRTTTQAQARTSVFDPTTPSAKTQRSTFVRATSATINGHVMTNSPTANTWFAWGTDLAHPTTTPVQTLSQESDVSVPLKGLTPSTTYSYRVFASNDLGTVSSGTRTFTTPAA